MAGVERTPGEMLGESNSNRGIDEKAPIYKTSFPHHNPVDIFRCFIAKQLSETSGLGPEAIFAALAFTFNLERGDLLLPLPRILPKRKSPEDAASDFISRYPMTRLIKPPQIFGVSLRFDFTPEALHEVVIPTILNRGNSYGKNQRLGLQNPDEPESAKRKIIVEFSSPNIAKEFHVGHLRSTIIGAFLANLYESQGCEVIRMNYLGDWGRQFGILAVGWERYGSEVELERDALGHLFEIYVKISADFKPEEDEYKEMKGRGENTSVLEERGIRKAAKDYVKRMEDGEESALALWKRFRDISIEKYESGYARLNIVFDQYTGESEVKKETMAEAERVLQVKGILEMSDGATIIDFKKHGAKKLGVAILRNRNNTSSYLLRDVGAAMQRSQQLAPDQIVYVVMSQQNTHLQQLIKILDLMGDKYSDLSRKILHVTFGRIQGMSTRKGTVRFLSDVLNDVGAAMHEAMRRNPEKYAQVENPEAVADVLGISSIMVQDMSAKRVNDYEFDLQRMLSFEGDTGPYLQYAHARLCSITRRTSYTASQLKGANFSLLKESHAIYLLRLLISWPDTVLHSYRTLEPATILTYLFRLSHALGSAYDVLKVLNAPEGPETSLARAALFEAAKQVLWNGMTLVGLSPVERM